MMMMMMVTGSKPVSSSLSSPSGEFVTPTKSFVASPANSTGTTVSATSYEGEGEKLIDEDEELEKVVARDTVLHDNVLYMSTPHPPILLYPKSRKKKSERFMI
eukprot:1663469-Ditylum_brightwellii.AAC.1